MGTFIAFEILTLCFGAVFVVGAIRSLIRGREMGRRIVEGYEAARPAVPRWWSGIYGFYGKLIRANTAPGYMATGAIMGLAMGLFLLTLGVLGLVAAIKSCY